MSQFILVYDTVPDHPALRTPGERICGEAAWVRLLMQARRNPGEGMHVGQLRTSYATLAEEWSWSRDQVRRYLARLERASMLRVEGTSAGLLVSIEKFGEYQRRRSSDKGVAPATPSAIPAAIPAATPAAMAPATVGGVAPATPSAMPAAIAEARAHRRSSASPATPAAMAPATVGGVAPATPSAIPAAIPAATPAAMAPATIRARFHEQVEQVDQDLPPSPPGGSEEGKEPVAGVPPIRMLALDHDGASVEIVFAHTPDPGIRGLLRSHGFSYGDLCDGQKGWCGPRSPQTAQMLALLGRKMPGEPERLVPADGVLSHKGAEPTPIRDPVMAIGDMATVRDAIIAEMGVASAERLLGGGRLLRDGDALIVQCHDPFMTQLTELYHRAAIEFVAVSHGYSGVRFESRKEDAA